MTTEERVARLTDRALALVLCVVEDRPPSPQRLVLRRAARAEWDRRVESARLELDRMRARAALAQTGRRS